MRILCIIGFHKWMFIDKHGLKRKCLKCGMKQVKTYHKLFGNSWEYIH